MIRTNCINNSMHYYLYEIRNILNGKIYIGVHKTKSLDDGYMGSGKVITRAIAKHGIENFSKIILETFDNPEAMFAREREVVNEEFLARDDVYNLRRGGTGGFDYINKSGKKYKRDFTDEDRQKSAQVCSERFSKEYYSDRSKKHHSKVSKETRAEWNSNARKQALSVEAKLKRKLTFEKQRHQQGENNSQAGTMWITDGVINSKISQGNTIPEGWARGRIIKK